MLYKLYDEKNLGVAMSSQKAKKSWKMQIFSVSQKVSDSKNAKIIFLIVKYVRYTYRLLFGGPKLTENIKEKCENCLSQIFRGWISSRALVSQKFWK